MASFTNPETSQNLLSRTFQRDVNCLSEVDRNTRKRALVRLQSSLFGKTKAKDFTESSPATRFEFFESLLQQSLLAVLSDPVEKCRELSMVILHDFVQDLQAQLRSGYEDSRHVLERLAPQLWKIVSARVNMNPVVEPSEEIRCGMVSLSALLVDCVSEKAPQVIHDNIDMLVPVITRASSDNFPDSKNASAQLAASVCKAAPVAMALHYATVLRALVSNMTHQRAKVRLTCLQAVADLVVLAGGFTGEGAVKTMADTVVPLIKSVGQDRAASVRQFSLSMMSRWAVEMPSAARAVYLPHLVTSLLHGLTDDAMEIQREALEHLEEVAARVGVEPLENLVPLREKYLGELPEPFNMPGVAAKGFPTPQVRALVCSVLDRVVPELSKEVFDWTVQGRLRAVKILRNVLVFGGEKVECYTPEIVTSLSVSCTDEEHQVVAVAMECAKLLGKLVPSAATLPVVVPRAQGVSMSALPNLEHDQTGPGGSIAGTAREKQGALCLLLAIVEGVSLAPAEGAGETGRSTIQAVLEALDCEAIRDCEEAEVQHLCVKLCDVIVERVTEASAVGVGPAVGTVWEVHHLLRILLQLSGGSSDEEDRQDAEELLVDYLPLLMHPASLLRSFHENVDPEKLEANDGFVVVPPPPSADGVPQMAALRSELWTVHSLLLLGVILGTFDKAAEVAGCSIAATRFEDVETFGAWIRNTLLENTESAASQWTKGSPDRIQLDQLVRATGSIELSKAGVLDVVVEVVLQCTQKNRDSDLRLSMLALLESMVKLPSSTGASVLDEFAPTLVTRVILPHLVWSAGRVASTMRKVSMYCFLTLLHSGALKSDWLSRSLARELLPAVRSSLDDQDVDTRRFTCMVISELFVTSTNEGEKLDEELSRSVYHDLIKRMDDASDQVRLAACEMLDRFIRASLPNALQGTACAYMLDTLMIHLDDADEVVQEAVMNVLKALAECVDSQLVKKRAIEERHRQRNPVFCDKLISLVE